MEISTKSKTTRKFIVWSPDGTTEPKVVHNTQSAAYYATKQMAKKHPNQEFYVMAQMGKPKRRNTMIQTNQWIKVEDYQAQNGERALAWSPDWNLPIEATFGKWNTIDSRGNNVAKHTGWMLAGRVGALYEDCGYFSESILKYYGIDAIRYILPMSIIELPHINQKEKTSC